MPTTILTQNTGLAHQRLVTTVANQATSTSLAVCAECLRSNMQQQSRPDQLHSAVHYLQSQSDEIPMSFQRSQYNQQNLQSMGRMVNQNMVQRETSQPQYQASQDSHIIQQASEIQDESSVRTPARQRQRIDFYQIKKVGSIEYEPDNSFMQSDSRPLAFITNTDIDNLHGEITSLLNMQSPPSNYPSSSNDSLTNNCSESEDCNDPGPSNNNEGKGMSVKTAETFKNNNILDVSKFLRFFKPLTLSDFFQLHDQWDEDSDSSLSDDIIQVGSA